MANDYIQFTIPDNAKKIRIRYNKDTDKINAEFLFDKENSVDKSKEETIETAKPTVGDHIKSALTGTGPGMFANPDE